MIRNKTVRATGTFFPSKNTTAIHLVQSSRLAQSLARLLVVGLFASILAMAFLPWQQSSRGTGQVVAYAPQERQQTIEAPVKGVVLKITEGLVEGSEVKKGDFILEIQPIARDLVAQLEGQLRELDIKLESAIAKKNAYDLNVQGFVEAGEFAVQGSKRIG